MKKAYFLRKAADLEAVKAAYQDNKGTDKGVSFVIEKILELPEAEYRAFAENLLADRYFIRENENLMCVDVNKVWHCILVKAEGAKEGILVEAEGYDYARYAAYYKEPDTAEEWRELYQNETVAVLRELAKKEAGNRVLLPDKIQNGWYNVGDLLQYIADMLE